MRNDYRQNANITDLAINKTNERIANIMLAVVIGVTLAVVAVAVLTA